MDLLSLMGKQLPGRKSHAVRGAFLANSSQACTACSTLRSKLNWLKPDNC
jgi:hypothetical protein